MLPGFRFLFAAILLSISLLVFGVGAAALLRATHEEFVANPAWRSGPQERAFAQASEPAQPVLAALRAEPEPTPATPSLRDQVPTIGLPNEVESTEIATSGTSSGPAVQVADIRPTEPSADEPVNDTVKAQVTAAPAEISSSQPAPADDANPVAETTPVTTGPAPPAAPVVASTLEPADSVAAPPPAEAATSATAVAALADPAAVTEKAPPSKAKATNSPPEAATKRRAHRPKKRHRVVRRPPPPSVQQTYDPFTQPQQQPAFAAATTPRKH